MPNQIDSSKHMPQLATDNGVHVDDITTMVQMYHLLVPVNPITNDKFTHDEIVHIICKYPDYPFDSILSKNERLIQVCVKHMESLLLREIISDMRLDAIQHSNALNDIRVSLNNGTNCMETIKDIHTIVKLARDSGV